MKKYLNLYAGLGGNVHKVDPGKYQITSVEHTKKIADQNQKLHLLDDVIIADAHQYLLDHHHEFDFIWSSPPCQSHTKMMKATRHDLRRYPDMVLYQEIVFLQNFYKGKWVVENVIPYYEPLIKPTIKMGRHLIWSNFDISPFDVARPKGFMNMTNTKGANALKAWLGVNYEGNIYYEGNHCPAQVLRNCVHPDLGLHILKCSE